MIWQQFWQHYILAIHAPPPFQFSCLRAWKKDCKNLSWVLIKYFMSLSCVLVSCAQALHAWFISKKYFCYCYLSILLSIQLQMGIWLQGTGKAKPNVEGTGWALYLLPITKDGCSLWKQAFLRHMYILHGANHSHIVKFCCARLSTYKTESGEPFSTKYHHLDRRYNDY